MKNRIKGVAIGVTMAVASVLGGAVQAATAAYTAASPGFNLSGAVSNGPNGYDVSNGGGFAFDFSSLNFSTISSFVLDVVYKRTGDQTSEAWTGTVASGNTFDLAAVGLEPATKTQITLTALDLGFLTAVSNKSLVVSFNLFSGAAGDLFFLKTACITDANGNGCSSPLSTTLTINYVAAVPLPAGAVLLLTGLGGLALARRRKV